MSRVVSVFPYPGEIETCWTIRRRVFIEEQLVTEREEIDGLDPECRHFLVEEDGLKVGTARLRDWGPGIAKAERVAVLPEYRGLGLGQLLMEGLETEARQRGCTEVRLGAQVSAISFYERLGYQVEGEEFLDARIPHRWMRRKLL